MAKTIPTSLLIGLVTLGASLTIVAACSNDASTLTGHKGTGATTDSDGGTNAATAAADAEAKFRALQDSFDKTCGNVCHKAGATQPTPPTFLAGPDPYVSIKAYKGIVVKDPYQSLIANKGAHEGPALGDTPALEASIVDWLKAESVAIVAVVVPTVDPVVVNAGPNDIDLTKACSTGLAGVHLTFTASADGGILSLSDMKLVVPAGTDAHLAHLQFFKTLAKPAADGTTELADPADTFSNLDDQFPNGASTQVAGGGAIFANQAGWSPWTLGTDKIQIQVDKLEPGKVKAAGAATTCKDAATFATAVLPSFKGAGVTTLNCSGCHNQNAPGGLSVTTGDSAAICASVLNKLNTTDITKSDIIVHVSPGTTHAGKAVNDIAAWTKLFTDNKGVFF